MFSRALNPLTTQRGRRWPRLRRSAGDATVLAARNGSAQLTSARYVESLNRVRITHGRTALQPTPPAPLIP